MTHTPGPWKIVGEEIIAQGVVLGCVYGAEDFPCRDDDDRDDISKECRANARLIEAAPELLAACKAFLAWFNTPHEAKPTSAEAMLVAARSAVAKAEGQN